MNFKIGDRVKVIKCNVNGDYCKNINKISTITEINESLISPYKLKGLYESFSEDELELVNQFTKSDLKDGDIVTYKNGDKRTVIAGNLINSNGYISKELSQYTNDLKDTVIGKNLDIIKVERPVQYDTVFERKEEILDETEKRYLASVIRPFRNKVEAIRKEACNKEFISIELKDEESINFPYFKKGTMYKGMKKHKKYTLKELEL